ncbi:MAG: tRNA (adenosine(37)-N6)-threonylcarbamoyltransferase complex ATPase subunit type 1 TsaE [Alloprevotella tannerae]|nr:tRNA (adenosine(37)-N6)-threonylcarbamoyltransferase complex ATPase subunit type 1 TsaE [Alloprevotella tannerae]
MTTIQIQSEADLTQAARSFIAAMKDRTIFAFYGKMGVGKTTFIKALCQTLGVEDVITSPTFSLVNEYTDSEGNSIFHFDFYRIKKLEEVYDMGYEDYLYSGDVCLLEWPELIEQLLPEDTVRVNLTENADGSRTLTMD